MPDHRAIRDHRHLRIFGTLLHDPNLFHLNRRSVAGAFAVGLFFAWVPVPFQMLLAAGAAIFFHTNLPISVGLVWISNPVTMPPLFYFAYLFGNTLLGGQAGEFNFELSLEWLGNSLAAIWQPFLLGCLLLGLISALAGYFGIRIFWRWHVIRSWERKKAMRRVMAGYEAGDRKDGS